jgi:hypothetical protein
MGNQPELVKDREETMGGFFETEKMKRHVEQGDQCKIAHLASNGIGCSECCDTYAEMFENVIDFECGEGPFEGGKGLCARVIRRVQ